MAAGVIGKPITEPSRVSDVSKALNRLNHRARSDHSVAARATETHFPVKGSAMSMTRMMIFIGAISLLTACGWREPGRVEGGAATGAATGAAIGLIAGPPGFVVGALVGGGAGAATGAVTSPRQVNL